MKSITVQADSLWRVDKTRNMEHSGTFRNIPEHEKIKGTFMKKNIDFKKMIIIT